MLRPIRSLLFKGKSEDALLVQRILADYAPRYWRRYGVAIALMAVAAGCTALAAHLLGRTANTIYVERNFQGLIVISMMLVALFCFKGLAVYGQGVMLARIANSVTRENQSRIFDKLLRQNMAFFANRQSADLIANSVHGAPSIANILNVLILALGRDFFTLAALVAVMVWQDPLLSLFGLVAMPIAILGVVKLMRRVRSIATTQYSGHTAVLETFQETLHGMKVIKAFNMEPAVTARMDRDLGSVQAGANKLARVSNRSGPLFEALAGIAIAAASLYAGYRMLRTGSAPGEFISFITAFLLAFEPAKRIGRVNVELSGNLVAARKLFETLDAPSSEPDEPGKPDLAAAAGRIELAGVRFAYDDRAPVLRGVDLIAAAGKVTALVGPSGSGKTTVFNLLLRYFEPAGGTITIDGQPIGNVSRRSLRRQIAYVGQDVFLFRGTVRENILVGRPDAGEEALIAAARAASAHDFIMKLPAGYDTSVGEFGGQLSHGQRQRIAVARALIKNAPIILLDEPTASLDSESERDIQAAIRQLCAGRTTLVIAHRLNTVLDADCIHVLEAGSVVESGSHTALLSKGGRYATFFGLQFPQHQQEAARGRLH